MIIFSKKITFIDKDKYNTVQETGAIVGTYDIG